MDLYPLIRPILFQFDAETAHRLVMAILQNPSLTALGRPKPVEGPQLRRRLFGLDFPNPVGLAAGLDKNAEAIDGFAALGFGHIEVGTITPRPQPGNPRPRLFRLLKDAALINRMGFNNVGAAQAAKNLAGRKSTVMVGANIGKNKDTPNEAADKDYLLCFEALYEHADYFTVNVSSPNTPGLRALQERDSLTRILMALQERNAAMAKPKPLLLKIAPDLSHRQLDDIAGIVSDTRIQGVIATNTTIGRSGLPHYLPSEIEAIGAGGLSGRPLRQLSTDVISYLHKASGGSFPIIGSGGIMNAADAVAKVQAGAAMVQLYTGFIYSGPKLISNINRALLSLQIEKHSG